MTFIEMQGVWFFLMKFRFHSGLLFYLVFHLPEILNSTACQWALDTWKSGTGVLYSWRSTLPDISCLFLLIKVGFPLQNQDAGAKKDKWATNIQEAHLHGHNLTFHNKQHKGTDIFSIMGLRLLDLKKNNLMITQYYKKDIFFPYAKVIFKQS